MPGNEESRNVISNVQRELINVIQAHKMLKLKKDFPVHPASFVRTLPRFHLSRQSIPSIPFNHSTTKIPI